MLRNQVIEIKKLCSGKFLITLDNGEFVSIFARPSDTVITVAEKLKEFGLSHSATVAQIRKISF